jgi:acyl-CoA synthetase (AMP-forming)/AMP-acid ligase II
MVVMELPEGLAKRTFTIRTLIARGLMPPLRPDLLLKIIRIRSHFGSTAATGYAVGAVQHPDREAIIDEAGALTFDQVHRRTNALAHALSDEGILEGDRIAIMCRNHRGFIEAAVACSKLGANVLYLNTAFAGPQLADVVRREGPVALIYDEEFTGLMAEAREGLRCFVAWCDDADAATDTTLDQLIARGDPDDVVPPSEHGKVVILTSGTTGTPKGAARKAPDSMQPVAILLDAIPLPAGGRTMIAAPMFHSWGGLHLSLAIVLGSTVVLRRHFDPEATLAMVAEHRCQALAVVPVMLLRILELEPETIKKHDTKSLEIIAASGSVLPGELATRVMDTFGDVLYNLYGSTEVGWATIASPQDMRRVPGTAGQIPFNTVVKLYDENGKEVPTGATGRIFVGNEQAFDGYTGGGTKEMINGLMSSGDVGHFEGDLLFVDGRDDEMIVSGGENVFPREVEDLLADYDGVDEVAIIGVPDEQFGQRLKAFVVPHDGRTLTEDELKEHVKSHLARYKVPREVEFLDELPRNATGKVLKRVLVEREAGDAQPAAG